MEEQNGSEHQAAPEKEAAESGRLEKKKNDSRKPAAQGGVSVEQLQSWAQKHLSSIWMVVVFALATISALLFFPNATLLLLGIGLVVGTLQSQRALHIAKHGLQMLQTYQGSTRLAALIGLGVIVVIFPFLLSLFIGALSAGTLVEHHQLHRIIDGE